MTFDQQGNLFPYQVIETDFDTFDEVFNRGFTNSVARPMLTIRLKALCLTLRSLLREPFRIWVDGSFVSRKQNPNDIDVVFFVNDTDYDDAELVLKDIVGLRFYQRQRLDCYVVRVYPPDHPRYQQDTEPDTKEWLSLFSRTRRQRDGKQYPKGIIELLF